GIRDYKVTGVQTCALPIFLELADHRREPCDDCRLRQWIRSRREITLRRLMHPQVRNLLQVEHDVELLGAHAILAREIDRRDFAKIGRASCRERVKSRGLAV